MKELLVPPGRNWWFDVKYPVWKCPDCGKPNRYVDTFGEPCRHCKEDHTLDWYNYIVDDGIGLEEVS